MTREQQDEIRRLRAMGEGYKKIGALLDLSVNTVKSFCRRDVGSELAETDDSILPVDDTQLCPRCHRPVALVPGHRRRVFCSDACRVAYWRMQARSATTKTCVGCGQPLFGHDRDRKYCSHDCYIAHRFGRTNGGRNDRSA